MTRFLLAAIATLTFASTTFAKQNAYSVRCADTASQKMTIYSFPADTNHLMVAFSEDGEGYPYTVDFTRATPEQIGTLMLPEGFDMFMGSSPDDAGLGLVRYMLLPTKMDAFKFTAFHGGHYADEAIVLDQKTSMECF